MPVDPCRAWSAQGNPVSTGSPFHVHSRVDLELVGALSHALCALKAQQSKAQGNALGDEDHYLSALKGPKMLRLCEDNYALSGLAP